jgi:hypothetical protein
VQKLELVSLLFSIYPREIAQLFTSTKIISLSPVEGSSTAGHARSKHGISDQAQANILNNSERIFSGKNTRFSLLTASKSTDFTNHKVFLFAMKKDIYEC